MDCLGKTRDAVQDIAISILFMCKQFMLPRELFYYFFFNRSTLSAHWINFHDPESGLLYMEWRAGTSPGQSDILAPTRLHVTNEVSSKLTQHLPLHKKVYVTLKVFNKAGKQIVHQLYWMNFVMFHYNVFII